MASEIKVDTVSEKTSANGVTIDGLNIKDSKIVTANSVDSDVYVDGSIDTAHIAADQIVASLIADDAINSEHYTDGSIDTAHIADGQVTIGKLATAVLTGATDIGAAIVDADLLLVDDGAGGTLRKTAASRIKTYIGDNTPAFNAFMAPDQSISADTYTKIVFDTEDYDSDGCYNHTSGTVTLNGISTPSYSFAPNVAGKYLIGAAVNSQSGTDFDTFVVAIFKNDTQINRVLNSSRHYDSAMTSFIVTANGTSDYFDIQCTSALGGGTTLEGTDSSSRLMWFSGTRIIGV